MQQQTPGTLNLEHWTYKEGLSHECKKIAAIAMQSLIFWQICRSSSSIGAHVQTLLVFDQAGLV